MNILQEKRDNIINDDSITKSGQKDLLDFLENLLPTTDEIVLKKPLRGELDFEILKDCHFDNIVAIVLEPGEVTHVKNIPTTVRRLHLANNLLDTLVDLPKSLVDLNIAGNGIKKLDLESLESLSSLEASDNELVELKLPKNIKTVIINNNRFRELDLDGLSELNKLHCNGNPLLSIRNFPDTIADFLMENNPTVEILRKNNKNDEPETESSDSFHDSNEINVNAEEAILEFYKLKNKYNNKVSEIKNAIYRSMPKKKQREERMKAIQETKFPCIHCTRPVNTVFSSHNRILKAKCGDEKSPCNLNIEIHAAFYVNIKDALVTFNDELEEKKENIIKIKMDTLFGYRTDNSAVKKFNKEYDEYKECDKILTNAKDFYEDNYFNKERQSKIQEKSKRVFQLQEEFNKLVSDYERKEYSVRNDSEKQEHMQDIVLLYTRELLPEYRNLQQLKYERMEIDNIESQLITSPVTLAKQNYFIGENSVVKRFTM